MFRGQTEHSIDDKNRLTVPAKFREELGETFFVTKGLDNCLFVFSGPEWEPVSYTHLMDVVAQTAVLMIGAISFLFW